MSAITGQEINVAFAQTAAGSVTAVAAPTDLGQGYVITGLAVWASGTGKLAINDGSADLLKIDVALGPNHAPKDFWLDMGAGKPIVLTSTTSFVNGILRYRVK